MSHHDRATLFADLVYAITYKGQWPTRAAPLALYLDIE